MSFMKLDEEARQLILYLGAKLCDLREQQNLPGHYDFSLSCPQHDRIYFSVEQGPHFLMTPIRTQKEENSDGSNL
jgi:hypothetical protein